MRLRCGGRRERNLNLIITIFIGLIRQHFSRIIKHENMDSSLDKTAGCSKWEYATSPLFRSMYALV